MTLPVPRPGLVIRYGFLWSHEKVAGADESAKDRPCAIIVAVRTSAGDIKVTVAPLTHSRPADPDASLQIDQKTALGLGLHDAPQWLRIDELNRFIWPGYDLRPRPDNPQKFDYGMLPAPIFDKALKAILARQKAMLPINVAGRD